MNSIAETKKTLLNARSLKPFIRDNFTFEEASMLLDKLSAVVDFMKSENEEKQKIEAEKQAKIESVVAQVRENGLDVEMLIASLAGTGGGTSAVAKSKREPRPAKYEYDDNGTTRTWTGQGRTPSAIQAELAKGKTLNDFLIAKTS